MSALPPKADILCAQHDVRFVPKADIPPSCDHLAWARATCAFALFLSITMSDEPIKLSLIKSRTLVVASEVRPADGGQEFMARHGILSKYAQHLTGHHCHFAFVNTPRGHAFMNRLDHYGDTERL